MYSYYLEEISLENVIGSVRTYEQEECTHIRKAYDYYNNKHKILDKTTTEGRPNNQVINNKLRPICDSYVGFINVGGIDSQDQFLQDNLPEIQDAVKDSIITGVGYTLAYYDKQLTLKRLYPTRAMIFRDTTISHNVIGGAFWNRYNIMEGGFAQEYIDLYIVDDRTTYYYKGKTLEGVQFQNKWSHNVPGIPLTEFRITSHYDSVISPAYSLQDMLNTIISSYADGRESFADPFIVISGCGISEESAQSLIDGDRKLLNLPLEGSRAEYLVRQDSGSDVMGVSLDVVEDIYQSCNCPNFTDAKFAAASGTALLAKCISFINACTQYRTSLDIAIQQVADMTSKFTYEWPDFIDIIALYEQGGEEPMEDVMEEDAEPVGEDANFDDILSQLESLTK